MSPADPSPSPRRRFKLFVPLLAGATLGDRLFASFGAVLGIGLTGLVCTLALGKDPHLPLIVAPIGASAVLLFAVPASPLAQPWAIIGGNTISALVGVTVSWFVDDPMIAIGLAVGGAIALMSLTRSLHPPGGAAALTGVIGGPAVHAAGFMFPFIPVALNCVLLVALGWVFHRFSCHSYPHIPATAPTNVHKTQDLPPQLRIGFRAEDVDGALADLGEIFDIDREDIDRLLRQVEHRAFLRSHGDLTCEDIMSRDVVSITADAPLEQAKALLLDHGIRTLPVTGSDGQLAGTVGLRELARKATRVSEVMKPAATSRPKTPASALLTSLTDGTTHSVVIVDDNNHIIGLVTQTDLLISVSRLPVSEDFPAPGYSI
jgi:CBS domain-containing membrane protein